MTTQRVQEKKGSKTTTQTPTALRDDSLALPPLSDRDYENGPRALVTWIKENKLSKILGGWLVAFF